MIVIDSEFQSLIPPLSDDEYERLERSILAEGVRDPIITWNGTIVDGHNRYNICQEHGIKCPQVEREFASRDAAKLYIIDNQLRRRNLPPAAIGDLRLEEKEIVAQQAKARQGTRTDITPNLGESSSANKHDGETLEQLAKDIPIGRESLRKLDVIKQKAKDGDPVAIREREALISGEKKSIHGAYMTVVGKPRPRKPEETVAEDGRRICAMCGEPINDGEACSTRPTVHKKCELEYQRDWVRDKRKSKIADDNCRICSICGEPIGKDEYYVGKPNMHKGCYNEYCKTTRYKNPDKSLLDNVATYTIDSLLTELESSAHDIDDAWGESIKINESMGVCLTNAQKKALGSAIANLYKTIEIVRKEQHNG